MEKNIKKEALDLKASKVVDVVKPAGSIKKPGGTIADHLDSAHSDTPSTPLGHMDVPHVDVTYNWKKGDTAKIKFPGKISKEKLIKLSSIGVKVEDGQLIVPSDKMDDFKKLFKTTK